MKSKGVNYKIEEPCHADWDQMKPEVKGRFCESCSKTVVDFSKMSDFSIVTYLENNKHQSVCGRFEEKQLEKTYLLPKSHYYPALGFDLKAVALGLTLSTFSALPSQAQNSTAIEQHDSIDEVRIVTQGRIMTAYHHTDESFAAGKIKLQGKEFSSVRISLMDGASTELASFKPEKNGTFKIPLDWTKDPVSIRVSSPGYGTQTVYFSNHKSLGDLSVTLYEQRMKMGKVISDR